MLSRLRVHAEILYVTNYSRGFATKKSLLRFKHHTLFAVFKIST